MMLVRERARRRRGARADDARCYGGPTSPSATSRARLSTNGEPTQGDDSFGGSPALVPVLRRAGFDALSLANNHAGDYGPVALVETVDALAASPIVPFGAGSDAPLRRAARRSSRPDGTRFAFVGFNAIGETPMATADTPGALSVRMPPRTGPLVRPTSTGCCRMVRRADRQADAVVVLPHWGTQYTHTPEPIQREVARELVAAGRRPRRRRSPALGAGHRRRRRRPGAPLARQLRLRHGLHGADAARAWCSRRPGGAAS